MKYVISKSRQKGSLPTVVKIEKSVLEFIEEEKKLAIKMGKLGMHLLKWEYINWGKEGLTTLVLFFLFCWADWSDYWLKLGLFFIPIFMSCINLEWINV